MGLWNQWLFKWQGRAVARPRHDRSNRHPWRLGVPEEMEPRQLLSANPLHVGVVYVEDDLGSDMHGDRFMLTFDGGAADSQLTRVTIDGDQNIKGFGVGDVFFDVAAGGWGADEPFSFRIDSAQGIDSVVSEVEDGGTRLVLNFTGFDAGESLVFTIDVDEVEQYDPSQSDLTDVNDGFDPITSGVEFQGSRLDVKFSAPYFYDASASAEFRNRYDAALAKSGLPLRSDDADGQRDRTAAAFAQLKQQPIPVQISGYVYHDRNNDGVRNTNEEGLAGIEVQIVPVSTLQPQTPVTLVTDSNGFYQTPQLAPGTYQILQPNQPDGYLDGLDSAGTVAGTPIGSAVNPGDTIQNVLLRGGETGIEYNFGEIVPASIEGIVYHDLNVDGARDPQEPGIAGVTVRLISDHPGQPVDEIETQTDSAGRYAFRNLPPGQYRIVEVQPDDFLDGTDTAGTVNGQIVGQATNPGDAIEAIVLASGEEGLDYLFGEYQPATLQGNVHQMTADGDCFGQEVQHPPVPGARVLLLDATGRQVAETLTDANGDYVFTNLNPGQYTVVEFTPEGLLDGGAHAGTVEGQSRGIVLDSGQIGRIDLFSGEAGNEFDFCEYLPGRLTGHVYHDRNDNGQRDEGEEGIDGVRIQLINDENTVIAETTTNAEGAYAFDILEAGNYRLREIQPVSWLDGQDASGTVAGIPMGTATNPGDEIRDIVLRWSEDGANYDFGELLNAQISGKVFSDVGVRDCVFDPESGDELLADVQIELLDADGNVLRQTTTDSQGQYQFLGLAPGTYTVREIQPAGYFDGRQRAGSGGGDDQVANLISSVVMQSGDRLTDYDFCEDPPVRLSGYVFQDGLPVTLEPGEQLPPRPADIRDGVRTDDDTRLAGVQLQLRDGVTGQVIRGDSDSVLPGIYGDGPIVVVTNAMGFYEFTGLAAGPYAVYEVQPDGYEDGVDTPGTQSGFAFNPGQPVPEAVLQTLNVDPRNDAIARILLPPGSEALENNFSEIAIRHAPPPLPPLPPIFPNTPETPLPPPPPTPPVIINLPVYEPLPILGQYEPEPYGHVFGSPNVHTWHLSVMDAGQPRGAGVQLHQTQSPIWFTSTTAQRARHLDSPMLRQGRWIFGALVQDVPDDVFFGLDHAIALAGDFNGDGRFEIAVFVEGEWFIDINGNRRWDNGDLWARLGTSKDKPVTGDWDGDGKWDIGIYGPMWPGDPRAVAAEPGLPDCANHPTGEHKNIPPETKDATDGRRVLKLTSQGPLRADVIDHVFHYGLPTDVPIVGDWNGDGIHTIGIFRAGRWHLDVDGNGRWSDADRVIEFGRAGDQPISGDFNGDGVDEVGYFRNGQVVLDTNANGREDPTDQVLPWIGQKGDQAVVGDWDGDGTDEVAVYRNSDAEPPVKKAG